GRPLRDGRRASDARRCERRGPDPGATRGSGSEIPGTVGPQDETSREARPSRYGASESATGRGDRTRSSEDHHGDGAVPDVRGARRDRFDDVCELRREVRSDEDVGGRARGLEPCRGSGDGRGGIRPQAKRQASRGRGAREGRTEAFHGTNSKTRPGAAVETRLHKRAPPRAHRPSSSGRNERPKGSGERPPQPNERPDEWAGTHERNHERFGPYKRLDEWAPRRPNPRVPPPRFSRDPARRRLEALCDSPRRGRPPSMATLLRARTWAGLPDPDRRPIQRLG